MRYTYKINDGTEIQAMSYKKMLKKLPSKYPEGTMLNIGYINKKKKLIFKDVKVGSNDWDIFRSTYGAQGTYLGLYFFYTKRVIYRKD